jgi:demethylspheroidene O-methyltransferase
LLKGEKAPTALQSYWAYADEDKGETAKLADVSAYTELMGQSQATVAQEILAAYDFSRHDHLLDIGGSNGSFILAAAARHKSLRFTLFDLPAVGQIARQRIVSAQLDNRVTVAEGSFLTDLLPGSADVATLIRVLHDHDDEAVHTILASARKALRPNGTLVVAEPLSGVSSIAPVADAYFGMYFAAMGQGKTRTAAEIAEMGLKTGFKSARVIPSRNPLITGLIVLTI